MSKGESTDRKRKPAIVVSKFGKVSDEEIAYVLKVIDETYERLKPHEVALLDLHVFEKSSAVDAFMAKETKNVGVISSSFGESFFAMHDAYRGTPRIILCLERMKNLPRLVQLGGIRHEVGHSVLHGTLLYYLLPLPRALYEIVNRFGISREYAVNLLYLISIAVKDYEVSRLLYAKGYVEDQAAYVKYLLRVTEDDRIAWAISRGNRFAEVLCLLSCLKSAGCAVPFLLDSQSGEDMKRLLLGSLSYIPKDFSKLLLNVVLEGFSSLGTDTLSNINQITCLVTESIVKPFFGA